MAEAAEDESTEEGLLGDRRREDDEDSRDDRPEHAVTEPQVTRDVALMGMHERPVCDRGDQVRNVGARRDEPRASQRPPEPQGRGGGHPWKSMVRRHGKRDADERRLEQDLSDDLAPERVETRVEDRDDP